MGFIEDFTGLGEGTECPVPYMEWCANSLIGAVAGRKLWVMHGRIPIFFNNYVCLVGTPGSGKSFAMGQAKRMFIRLFPSHFISESVQSREDILNKMTNDACVHTWKDEHFKYTEEGQNNMYNYRPFYCLIDEMENFVSVDEKKMVATLVGIYGEDSFGTGFKNDANKNQRIHFPYFNLLACTVPAWMMSSLRVSLFVGGLGRRLVIVYCNKTKDIPHPNLPPYAKMLQERMDQFLLRLNLASNYGCLTRTPEAIEFWDKWYLLPNRKNKFDPILIQFHETQHISVLKLAGILALSDNPETRIIELQHLQKAVLYYKKLDNDIIRLTSGIGRNELAGVGAQVLDFIARMGGGASKTMLMKTFTREFRLPEFMEQMSYYEQANQLIIHVSPKDQRTYYLLPGSKYADALQRGEAPPEVNGEPG